MYICTCRIILLVNYTLKLLVLGTYFIKVEREKKNLMAKLFKFRNKQLYEEKKPKSPITQNLCWLGKQKHHSKMLTDLSKYKWENKPTMPTSREGTP